MNKSETAFVALNPHRCVACWKCVGKCPKRVIGRVRFLWHKHVVFRRAADCIGCGKCIKTCPKGAFSEILVKKLK